MNVTVHTSAQVDSLSARILADAVKGCPKAVLGLSTGHTTGSIHKLFCRLVMEEGINVSQVTFFGVDEVSGVSRFYPGACYSMLRSEVMDPLGVREENFLMLPTESEDFDASCRAFTAELERRGGVDLLFLGLGGNGHLGFNQPGTPFSSTAWHSVMYPELEERIRRETGTPADKPLGGVTLGLKDIMQCRRVVLAAKGAAKAEIVGKVINGPVCEAVPASVLQLHPDCRVLLDTEAAQLI